MKRYLILIILLVFSIFLFKDITNQDEQIRIRVIANSDSNKDQDIKKDVLKYLYTNYNLSFNNSDECESFILNNIEDIKDKLNKLNHNIEVTYETHIFNNKTYNDKVSKQEEYKTLLIKIDNAKGKNFWGILYSNHFIENENTIEYKSFILELLKEND